MLLIPKVNYLLTFIFFSYSPLRLQIPLYLCLPYFIGRKRKSPDVEAEEASKEATGQPAKKRGRPKGSKNKAKEDSSSKSTETIRARAEKAADPNTTEAFFDSGDVCNICNFPLDHETKRKKPKMECPRCELIVHKPCYEKSGCTCEI